MPEHLASPRTPEHPASGAALGGSNVRRSNAHAAPSSHARVFDAYARFRHLNRRLSARPRISAVHCGALCILGGEVDRLRERGGQERERWAARSGLLWGGSPWSGSHGAGCAARGSAAAGAKQGSGAGRPWAATRGACRCMRASGQPTDGWGSSRRLVQRAARRASSADRGGLCGERAQGGVGTRDGLPVTDERALAPSRRAGRQGREGGQAPAAFARSCRCRPPSS
eukprot:6660195-Prymnesium_polylepis.1